MTQSRLSEFDFVDLYVCLEGGAEPHYHKTIIGLPQDRDIHVPEEFKHAIDGLTRYLQTEFKGNEMGVAFDGVRMRASKIRTSSGLLWAVLRKIKTVPPEIGKLGFMPPLVPHLQALGQRDGLILVCGSTGQGKTTTSTSLLLDYMNRYGGVGFTIEDPVEYFLEGPHGKSGYCYQVEVEEDKEWAEMLKRSLRWHPRYIFVGEVRTPDAANQLLRAATSGHLVITTVHAGTIEEALEGLLQLAGQSIGERANNLLATGLTAVIHQTLTPTGIRANSYITDPNNPASPFRASIREKRIGQTRTFIDQQVAMLMQGGKLFRD